MLNEIMIQRLAGKPCGLKAMVCSFKQKRLLELRPSLKMKRQIDGLILEEENIQGSCVFSRERSRVLVLERLVEYLPQCLRERGRAGGGVQMLGLPLPTIEHAHRRISDRG